MADQTDIEKREAQELQRAERTRAGRTFVPRVDIVEQENELLLLADMPGVQPDGLDIRYERGELTIHGKVEQRQGSEQADYMLREYGIGDFYRAFQVGEEINPEKIEAEVKDGVLTLHLPKTERAVPRKITVKTE
jgi:HSP20 family protein